MEGKKGRPRVAKGKTYFPRLRLVIFLEMDFMSPELPLAGCSAAAAEAAGAGAGEAGVEAGVDMYYWNCDPAFTGKGREM